MSDKNQWPAFRYGPNGQSVACESEADVPKGWQDHPSKVEPGPVPPARTSTRAAPAGSPGGDPAGQGGQGGPITPAAPEGNLGDPGEQGDGPIEGTDELDADGWPFDDNLHAATRTRTKADLWRMKVGATRPDPKPGYPKPALDL